MATTLITSTIPPIQNANEGIDTIVVPKAFVGAYDENEITTYSLNSKYANVENLTIASYQPGGGNLFLEGNDADNVITGTSDTSAIQF